MPASREVYKFIVRLFRKLAEQPRGDHVIERSDLGTLPFLDTIAIILQRVTEDNNTRGLA